MCKLFYSITASNFFANVFTVTVLSADRCVLVGGGLGGGVDGSGLRGEGLVGVG